MGKGPQGVAVGGWRGSGKNRPKALCHRHRRLPTRWEIRGKWKVRRPVSRVLSPCGGWPFLWDARCRAPRATDPGGGAETRFAGCPACRPYLVLLPVGFAVPLALPLARWALTPPFHPCLPYSSKRARPTGGLFSVALSLGSPPPAVSRHRVSVEPGLSSPRGCSRSAAIRPSDPRR